MTAGHSIISATELILGYINIRNVCFPISRGAHHWCIIEAEMLGLVLAGLSACSKAVFGAARGTGQCIPVDHSSYCTLCPRNGGSPFVVSAGDDGFTTAPPVMTRAYVGTLHGIAPHQVKPSYDKDPSRVAKKKTGPDMGHKWQPESEYLSGGSYFTSTCTLFVSQP